MLEPNPKGSQTKVWPKGGQELLGHPYNVLTTIDLLPQNEIGVRNISLIPS